MLSKMERFFYENHYKKITHKVAKGTATITRFFEITKRPYLAISWGKDSLVCLDLAYKINPEITAVWVDRGEGGDIPDVYDMVNAYRAAGVNIRRITTETPILDIIRDNDLFEINRKKMITKQLKQAFKKIAPEYDGFIWGLRIDEAIGRKKLLLPRGPIFKKKNGHIVCSPVWTWSARDIWAYIICNNLRYNSYYDLVAEGYLGREKVRYANWAGTFGFEEGRKFHEIRKHYPELFEKLARIKPIVRSYT